MKKICLFISILFYLNTYSQEKFISLSSPNVDTLFFYDNDIGKILADIWNKEKESRKPVIILKNLDDILALKNNHSYLNDCEEKRRIMNQYKYQYNQ